MNTTTQAARLPFSRDGAIRAASLLAVLLAGGCAGRAEPAGAAAADQPNDPAERANRVVFAGNQFVDRNALQPVARGYRDYVPGQVRTRIGNFASNLSEPGVAINDVLQGNFRAGWTTARRFVVNSTVGGAGLFDVATGWDLPHHQADFGQTFGVWGAGPGPVVELPLLGSSNVRDTAGAVLGFVANPFRIVGGAASTVSTVGSGGGLVDMRANLLDTTRELERGSLDYYATLRSLAAQRRDALVRQGRQGGLSRPAAEPVSPAVPAIPTTPDATDRVPGGPR